MQYRINSLIKKLLRCVCALLLSGVLAAGALCFLLPVPSSAAGQTDTSDAASVYTLPIFETSDIHGYLADTSTEHYEYRLAYISDKVRDRRTVGGVYRKDCAVLLDGGDIFQGNTMSNLLKGSSMSAAFIRMDYDAVTIGNHEFDWGIETVVDPDGTLLDSMLEETPEVNAVPVVSTNMYLKREKIPFASEYLILEKTALDEGGNELPVRIGVIGFTEDHSSSIMTTKFSGAGFMTLVDYSNANRIAEELEASGQCDATILLTHGAAEDAAYNLGEGSAIDLVLGGHTHSSVSGKTPWGLSFLQPAAYSTAYCLTEMTFASVSGKPAFQGVDAARTVSVTDSPSKLYPTAANASDLDPEIVALTDRVIGEISELLNAYVGYIPISVKKSETLPGSGGRATVGGNFMASIIARAVGAEVGFVNSGGIRTDLVITSGWRRLLTVSDMYTMFPFNNRLYCYELTYEDFLTLLRYALTESGGSLLSRMTGIECYYIGEEVQAIVRDGKAIYADNEWQGGWKDRKIRVGVSEFVATSNRVAGTMQNPLVAWSKTSRLISSDLIDAEGAFQVLDAESEANHWELSVDKTAYFVYGRYMGPVWSEEDEKAYEAAENETASGESEVTEPAVSTAPADESSPSREAKDRFAFLKNPLLPLIPVVLIVLVFGIIRWRQQTAEKDDNEPDGPESAE